jgi:hypothetical protein
MKKYRFVSFLLLLFFSVSVFSQKAWTKLNEKTKKLKQNVAYRESIPSSFNLFSIEKDLITGQLFKSSKTAQIIELPTPNGIQRFEIKEASIFADALAAKFPTIKSYVGVGLDDPTARVRLSNSKIGLHAMISSGEYPMYLIDPYTKDKKVAIAYLKNRGAKSRFECLVDEVKLPVRNKNFQKTTNANDGKLRTYRLALIGTAEYSQYHLTNQGIASGASNTVKKAAVLAAMNVSMTRVNGVFERDLSVTMELVGNNDDLIFLDASTDGLSNNDINSLLTESQAKCDAVIGSANYDIGHALGTGGYDGVALRGMVCVTGQKAKGATMSPDPIGDAFDIDFVIHEMGHQFGANHTFNNSCRGNRNDGDAFGPSTAVEPGSGSTIMAYANICPPNVQDKSDAYFHAVSIAEMWNYVSTTTCGLETTTGNTAPTANAGADFTIPKSTPFVLKGIASDADSGNALTYTWEQLDNEIGAIMPPASTNTGGPLFRSLAPSSSINRYMPELSTVLAGNTSSTWEVLPSIARTMDFAFTVRDNVANGAATARDDTLITVAGDSGPFVVTSQNTGTTLNGNSTQTITWNVADTNVSPINCTHVTILLSTDGGNTFPNVLAANTPNDGNQDVAFTNIVTTEEARIKIEPVNNIFYAVNSTSFSIDQTASIADELFSDFKVYPNPSKGRIKVSFDLKSSDNTVVLKLFDIRGIMLVEKRYEVTATEFAEEINYESVVAGLYVLKVENGANRISKKILIE